MITAEQAPVQEAGAAERLQRKVAGKCAQHHHIAVGKVDHEEDAIDQRVAQGDEGIDAAQDDARDGKSHPNVRAIRNVPVQDGPQAPGQKDNSQHADGRADPPAQVERTLEFRLDVIGHRFNALCFCVLWVSSQQVGSGVCAADAQHTPQFPLDYRKDPCLWVGAPQMDGARMHQARSQEPTSRRWGKHGGLPHRSLVAAKDEVY